MKTNYSPELRTKLFETNVLNFNPCSTDNWRLLKLWVATLVSVAISWQLNAVPYLCGLHKPCPLLWKGLCQPCAWLTHDFACAHSLVPRPMLMPFDLGTRLHVHMHTNLENGILHNGPPPQSVANGFYWPGWIWSNEDAEWFGSYALWWASVSC